MRLCWWSHNSVNTPKPTELDRRNILYQMYLNRAVKHLKNFKSPLKNSFFSFSSQRHGVSFSGHQDSLIFCFLVQTQKQRRNSVQMAVNQTPRKRQEEAMEDEMKAKSVPPPNPYAQGETFCVAKGSPKSSSEQTGHSWSASPEHATCLLPTVFSGSLQKANLQRSCCSVAKSCPALCDPIWTAACQAFLSFTISQSLLKTTPTESVMPSNHLILCCPLLLLPSIFPRIRVSSKEPVLHIRWPKYWSFSFSMSPSSEYSGLISFRTDWLDLLAVQGTLRVFSSTTVWKHQFFSAQPSLSPSLTSTPDYWKNHSFDSTDFWWQSDVSAF